MTDWTDEVRARLEAPSTVSGTWGVPEDGPWCVKREADIRAALEEIERRGLQYPDDLGVSRDAAGLSARCAELRDRLVAQGERAEAAEAKLAEAEGIVGLQNAALLAEAAARLEDALAGDTSWLVEYLNAEGNCIGFYAPEIPAGTDNPQAALRLSRREDAEAVRRSLPDGHLMRSAEHVFTSETGDLPRAAMRGGGK